VLRVRRPDGRYDEFYLANGLTIGRTLANTVVLADDDSVDRSHAHVQVAEDGIAHLRCLEAGSSLTSNGVAVRDLALDAGVRFEIGRTEFQCVSGRLISSPEAAAASTACPFCRSTEIHPDEEGILACPGCSQPILAIRLDPASASAILVPAVYGDCVVERFIGRGGMGLVLKGERHIGEAIAIKIMPDNGAVEWQDDERFLREVTAMSRVCHPNVVKLLGHGKSGSFNYLVQEWVNGPSLRQLIAEFVREGKMYNFTTGLRWFVQVCNGLSAIHAARLVHRDIKPSNILIGPDGIAKIADFGIAKRIDAAHTSYTTTGNAPGTFEYMAPEQINAPDKVDSRADLYALGITSYELLTGIRPVGSWQPASTHNLSVPTAFDTILGHLLAPKPGDRYDRVEDVIAAIESLPRTSYVTLAVPSTSIRSTERENEIELHNPISRRHLDRTPSSGNREKPSPAGDRTTSLKDFVGIATRNGCLYGATYFGLIAILAGVPISLLLSIAYGDVGYLIFGLGLIILIMSLGTTLGFVIRGSWALMVQALNIRKTTIEAASIDTIVLPLIDLIHAMVRLGSGAGGTASSSTSLRSCGQVVAVEPGETVTDGLQSPEKIMIRTAIPVIRWLRPIAVICGWLMGTSMIVYASFALDLSWNMFDWHGPTAGNTDLSEFVTYAFSVWGLVLVSRRTNDIASGIGSLFVTLFPAYAALLHILYAEKLSPPGGFLQRTQLSPLWFRLLTTGLLLSPIIVWLCGPFRRWMVSIRSQTVFPSQPLVKLRCLTCGGLNSEDSRFCGQCGSPF
jgi:serine/threonine protein kinase